MSDGDPVPAGTDETTGGATATPVLADEAGSPDLPPPPDEAAEDVAPGEPAPGEGEALHPLFAGYDRDGDGEADLVAFDRNTDGQFDALLADQDFDGRPDHAVLDENLDGRVDAEIFDPDEDGELDLVLVDENRDGQFDTAHFGDEDSNPLPETGDLDVDTTT